jgi:hypothetical protein
MFQCAGNLLRHGQSSELSRLSIPPISSTNMLVGKIIEKPSSSSANPPPPPRAPTSSSAHSFPPVLHRSQRATSRFGSNAQKVGESSKSKPTASIPKSVNQDEFESLPEGEKVRRMVDDENTQRVASMTAEEREEEVGELKARFGSGLEDLMRRRREKREGKQPYISAQASQAVGPGGGDDENTSRVAAMSDEERKEELKELEERFGSATLDALRTRALKKHGSASLRKEESSKSTSQMSRKSHLASQKSLTTQVKSNHPHLLPPLRISPKWT